MQYGPVSFEELMAAGPTPETMVWHEGMPDWAPASQVPEIMQALAPAAPVVPPAPPVAPPAAPVPEPTPVVEPEPAPVVEPAPTPEPVVEPAPFVEPAPAPVVEPAPAPAPVVEPEPAPAPMAAAPTPAPAPKKSKTMLWVIIAVVALLLIGGGVAAFFLLGGNGSKDKPETPVKADTTEVKPVAAPAKVDKVAELWTKLSKASLTFSDVEALNEAIYNEENLPEEADTLVERISNYGEIVSQLRNGDIDAACKIQKENDYALLPVHERYLKAAYSSHFDGDTEVPYTPAQAAKAKEVFKSNHASYQSFEELAAIGANSDVLSAVEAKPAAPKPQARPVQRQTVPVQRTTTRTNPTPTRGGMRSDVRNRFDRARSGY